MKIYFNKIHKALFFLLIVFLTSCSNENQLSKEEQADGWELLFNGEDLNHWRGYGIDFIPDRWTISNGTLFFDPDIEGIGGDIVSKDMYGEFDLKMEWKLAPGSNSGVFFHVVEDKKFPSAFFSSPEMQIVDNEGHEDGKNPLHRDGGLYDLIASSVEASKPIGEWNDIRILVVGNKLEQWLNGQKVVETIMWDDNWVRLIEKSKYATWPDFGKSKVGHIALQDHGEPVWFRNIKIKRLD